MKQIIPFIALSLIGFQSQAQTKSTGSIKPDMEKLMKMTPAEREAYAKQLTGRAVDFANTNNLSINKTALARYDLKPPVKDIKKLSLIPSRPPNRTELVNTLQQSIQIIQKGIPGPKIEEVNTTINTLPIEKISPKAVMEFYGGDKEKAMLMMMKLAGKEPDSILNVNNLGAMYNLVGAGHKAVPLFEYCLQKVPNNSLILGNIGQSYMQLGDMLKAAAYLRKCLDIDSLNVEANHTMGMIYYFKNEYDKAMACFSRELSIAMSRSTLAMAKRMGKKFNLRELYKRKMRRNGVAEKDFMEDILLGKFTLPDYPANNMDFIKRQDEFKKLSESILAEQLFWMTNAQQVSTQYVNSGSQGQVGLYADLVQEMLEQLDEEFTPEYVTNYNDDDRDVLMEIVTRRTKQLNEIVCTEAPQGSSIEVQQAYAIKCCEERIRTVADAYVSELSAPVVTIFTIGVTRWKAYINEMIAIMQLDPSAGNRIAVCNAAAGYFGYLGTALKFYQMGDANNFLSNCVENYNPEGNDSLIQSNRLWSLDCAPWMNVAVEYFGATIKADCNKLAIEAGSNLMGALEHEWKTHRSTLLLGPGMKADWYGFGAEIKTQAYLTFDENLDFADVGVKRTGEIGLSGTPLPIIPKISVGSTVMGVEASEKWGINSGYSSEIEWKGGAAAYVEWLNSK